MHFDTVYTNLVNNSPHASIEACNAFTTFSYDQQRRILAHFQSHALPAPYQLEKEITFKQGKKTYSVNHCWLAAKIPYFDSLIRIEKKNFIKLTHEDSETLFNFIRCIVTGQPDRHLRMNFETLSTIWEENKTYYSVYYQFGNALAEPFDLAFANCVDKESAPAMYAFAKLNHFQMTEQLAANEMTHRVVRYFKHKNTEFPNWIPSEPLNSERLKRFKEIAPSLTEIKISERAGSQNKITPDQIKWILDQTSKEKLNKVDLEETSITRTNYSFLVGYAKNVTVHKTDLVTNNTISEKIN